MLFQPAQPERHFSMSMVLLGLRSLPGFCHCLAFRLHITDSALQ
jgi:hypothetical protein